MTTRLRPKLTALTLLICGLLAVTVAAEQKRRLGNHDVHYIVLPTTFLQPAIASQYNLPRGRDRALVNISVLTPGGQPVVAKVSGTATNLIGQAQELDFREVREGKAVYYLAVARTTNEEHLRFAITITTDNGDSHTLEFRQKMYWDE